MLSHIQNILTLDFESYFNSKEGYSLKKLTTEEYIRSPQFLAHGCAYHWYGDSTTTPEYLRQAELDAFFASVEWGRTAILCHNAAFDGAILSWFYGHKPCFVFDTLSMARALRGVEGGNSLEKLAEDFGLPPKGKALHGTDGLRVLPEDVHRELASYCEHDTWLCEEIFKRLSQGFPKKELEVIDSTLQMYLNPVLELDAPLLEKEIEKEAISRGALLSRLAIDEKQLASNDKFATALRALGCNPPLKTSKSTGKSIYAFAKSDAEFQALCGSESDDVRLLCEARLRTKSTLERTRAQRFLDISERGCLPVPLNYYGAHCVTGDVEVLTRTGWVRLDEWSGGDIAQVTEKQDIIFLPAERFVGPETNSWVSVVAPYVQCSFTLGHTVPYLCHGSRKWATMQAGELADRSSVFVPISGVFQTDETLSENQARIVAMVQADGHWETNTKYGRGLSIFVKKERKKIRIRELFASCGIIWRELVFTSHPGFTRFVVAQRDCPSWLRQEYKYFGAWLMKIGTKALKALVDELKYWDGWVQGNQDNFSTAIKENADWIATACHLVGYAASITKKTRSFCVAIRKRNFAQLKTEHIKTHTAARQTFCTITKTGYWLARSNGRIFVTGNTGRWSASKGSGINLQNLKRGSFLRQSIHAPPGYILCVGDLAQIEVRILAQLAQDEVLLNLFRSGVDVYATFGSGMFGQEISKETHPLMRQSAKSALLGCGFMLSWANFAGQLIAGFMGAAPVTYDKTFAKQLGVTAADVYSFTSNEALMERALQIPRICDEESIVLHCIATKKIVEKYRAASPRITQFWKTLGNLLETAIVGGNPTTLGPLGFDKENIRLPSGMSLRYPDLRATKDQYGRNQWTYNAGKKRKKVYSGSLTENVVQAVARCVMSDAMIALKKLGLYVALTVHDELMIVVKESEAEWAEQTMHRVLTTSPLYLPNIPLDATVSCAKAYGDAK